MCVIQLSQFSSTVTKVISHNQNPFFDLVGGGGEAGGAKNFFIMLFFFLIFEKKRKERKEKKRGRERASDFIYIKCLVYSYMYIYSLDTCSKDT